MSARVGVGKYPCAWCAIGGGCAARFAAKVWRALAAQVSR